MSAPNGMRDRTAPLSRERWLRVEEVLEAALALGEGEREEFLARECGEDEELRQEVASLLDASPVTGFLERPALRELAAPTFPTIEGAPAPLPAMALAPRDDIAPRLARALEARYALEGEVGRGGMAIVYRARDLRHRRAVAIKVLYPELSAILGPDRFLHEIELTASLQHPHILPLYDSGSAEGLLYYVMPFVDGETLRLRLARERHLPVGDAVRIAAEVADALGHAHARGVVHRDVKPENILLQGEHALVADFGIALAVQQASGERMTRTGLSLGTPEYMAPEQAMGDRAVDARADVYALGAVTWEMLAGEAPFTGPTSQAVVARVLTESPPPLVSRRPTVPPNVAAAVRTAMERIPADRFATAAAFAAALADPSYAMRSGCASPRRDDSANGSDSSGSARLALTRRSAMMLGATVLLGLGATGTIGWLRGRSTAATVAASAAATPVMRFAVDGDSVTPGVYAPAISPDGKVVAFMGKSAKGTMLFVRRLGELGVRAVPETEYGELPFFSPDGEWIGYYAAGAIWKVRAEGGRPTLVTRLPGPHRFEGASWGGDETMVIALSYRGLMQLSLPNGELAAVPLADTTVSIVQPHHLPGGRGVLVTVVRDEGPGRIGVIELATGKLREFGSGAGARYASGELVYSRGGGELFAQPFDLDALQPTGRERRIDDALDAAASTPAQLAAAFDVASEGAIIYRSGARPEEVGATRLAIVDRTGREVQSIAARTPWSPRFSPDGRRIVYGAYGPGRESSDLWVSELATGDTRRLTDDGNDSNDPRWSPDGTTIAYSANSVAGKDLFTYALASGERRHLTSSPGSEWPSDWNGNGEILYTQWRSPNARDVRVQPAAGGEGRVVLSGEAQESGATLSPDGRLLAYQSDESGRPEIWLTTFPVSSWRVRLSTGGGVNPMWRRDGEELYYWGDDALMAVRLASPGDGGRPKVVGEVALFRAGYVQGEHAMYDVSPDGSRIVMVSRGAREGRVVVAMGLLGRR